MAVTAVSVILPCACIRIMYGFPSLLRTSSSLPFADCAASLLHSPFSSFLNCLFSCVFRAFCHWRQCFFRLSCSLAVADCFVSHRQQLARQLLFFKWRAMAGDTSYAFFCCSLPSDPSFFGFSVSRLSFIVFCRFRSSFTLTHPKPA